MTTYTMTFTGGTANSKIILASTSSSGKKRAYLDNIIVYTGEVAADDMAKPAADNTQWPMEVTGITTTSYPVFGLEQGYVYSYKVKAVTAENEESAYSNVVKVDLSESTGICELPEMNARVYAVEGNIVIECEEEQPVEVVNLMGQVVASTTANGRTLLSVPAKGVYIVRCGLSTTRVMIP